MHFQPCAVMQASSGGDRASAAWSCCDWRCCRALHCKPWKEEPSKQIPRNAEEPQLKSHSRGCTCRPDSSLFQQHPCRCVLRSTAAMVTEERAGYRLSWSISTQSFPIRCSSYQAAGLTSRDQKTSLQVSRESDLPSMPLEAQRAIVPKRHALSKKGGGASGEDGERTSGNN